MFFKELQKWEEARRVIIYLHREMTIKFPQGREEALSELTVITNGQTKLYLKQLVFRQKCGFKKSTHTQMTRIYCVFFLCPLKHKKAGKVCKYVSFHIPNTCG